MQLVQCLLKYCIQYFTNNCSKVSHKSIAHFCTSLVVPVLHTIVCKYCSSFCTLSVLPNCTYCTHCSYCTYWSIVPIFAHYCAVLLTKKLINSAAACFFRPLEPCCALLAFDCCTVQVTMLLSIQLTTLVTFKSTIVRVCYDPPAAVSAALAESAAAAARRGRRNTGGTVGRRRQIQNP